MPPLKYYLLASMYLAFIYPSLAADITTTDGRIYADYVVQRKEPDGLHIRHSKGIIKVFAWELSPEIRELHELDIDTARRYHAFRQRAQHNREQEMRQNLETRNNKWGEYEAKRDAEKNKQDILSRNARDIRVEIVHIDSNGCYARPYKNITSSTGPRNTGSTWTGTGVARTHTTGRSETHKQYGNVVFIACDTANKRIGETWTLKAALVGRQQSPKWGTVDKYEHVK